MGSMWDPVLTMSQVVLHEGREDLAVCQRVTLASLTLDEAGLDGLARDPVAMSEAIQAVEAHRQHLQAASALAELSLERLHAMAKRAVVATIVLGTASIHHLSA